MNEKQMQEMAVSILLDEYTQLDVAQLLKEYEEDGENGELPNVPRALDEKCTEMIRRVFAKKNRKKQFARITKILSKAAMIVLMLIGLCTVSVLSVKAWREPALRMVLETFGRYSSAGIEGNASYERKTPADVIEKLSKIVPTTYKLAYKHVRQDRCLIRYTGQNGEIINLVTSVYQHGIYFDAEDAEGIKMQINECDVVFIAKNGYKAIWLDENKEMLIECSTVNISEEAFWDIVYELIK